LQSDKDRGRADGKAQAGFGMTVWVVPGVLLAVATGAHLPHLAILWVVVTSYMGAACLINAKRCHRLHCYFTGPFFLLLALAALLFGLRLIDLGPQGWDRMVLVMVIGACVLVCVPEWLFGKYRR